MKKLKAPMSFQGGKQRIADRIVDIIKHENDTTTYVDLCCGSGAVSVALINSGVHPEHITMVDASDWGNFWCQVSQGTFDMCWFEDLIAGIPDDKRIIKEHLESYAKDGYDESDVIDVVPIWLMLQAGSFGGKHIWTKDGAFCNASFRSYWQPTETSSRRSPVNPMMPMPNTLLRQVKDCVEVMSPIKAAHCDVLDFNWQHYDKQIAGDRVIVFIDPPYEGTTGYGFKLDYVRYLEVLKTLPNNYDVFITDYKCHSSEFWELSNTNKGGISGANKKRQEILSKVA